MGTDIALPAAQNDKQEKEKAIRYLPALHATGNRMLDNDWRGTGFLMGKR